MFPAAASWAIVDECVPQDASCVTQNKKRAGRLRIYQLVPAVPLMFFLLPDDWCCSPARSCIAFFLSTCGGLSLKFPGWTTRPGPGSLSLFSFVFWFPGLDVVYGLTLLSSAASRNAKFLVCAFSVGRLAYQLAPARQYYLPMWSVFLPLSGRTTMLRPGSLLPLLHSPVVLNLDLILHIARSHHLL